MLGARGTVQGGRVFADGAVDAAGHRHARQALLLHPLRLHVVHLSVHQTQSSSPVHIHALCRPAVTLMYMREAHTMLEHQEALQKHAALYVQGFNCGAHWGNPVFFICPSCGRLLTVRRDRLKPGLGDSPGFEPAAAGRMRCASVTSDPTESCESLSPAACTRIMTSSHFLCCNRQEAHVQLSVLS